ncbi:NUDIX hydrolase [bacterium]|nr:NUDIX hydrolase [bacterium]
MKPAREKKIKGRVLYRGRILDVFVDTVRVPGGGEHIREVVGHRPAVAIVPVLPKGKIVIIRQYRYAVKKYLWELPAGLIDRGETPLKAARRELLEETGYQAGKMHSLVSVYSSPGFSQEKIHLFIARDLKKVSDPALDSDEFLVAKVMAWRTALTLVRKGEIEDGKTVLGLMLAREK